MRALVTGVAGFIGSHLAEALIARGDHVTGVDAFTPYYDPARKRANIAGLVGDDRFDLVEADLGTADVMAMLDGVDTVFHQAGQPGVRLSWHAGFAGYVEHNVLATQRLLEAALEARPARLVYASSSSVYGQAPAFPTSEDSLPRPHSPYGVTKLAAEHLCRLYASNWSLPTVSLRYFTVFGPRQRPDMATYRLLRAGLERDSFPLFGTGEQVRDFTFVADVVAANLAAADADVEPGTVLNIAGGGSTRLIDLVRLAGEVLGHEIEVESLPSQPGDVERTGGSIERAQRLLGWAPQVELRAGVEAQARWQADA